MRSVELFAGAGGLALGCAGAGFHPARVVEWNRWACDTIRHNREGGHPLLTGCQVSEGDVRDVDWSSLAPGDIDLVSGGPPCQPFSAGGRAGAADDPRDMFPAATEVIRRLRPRAFIIENVRGLTRPAFSDYFDYIKLRLALPSMVSRSEETWVEHLGRLRREASRPGSAPEYRVAATLVNAADYGVPQHRHRVFLVGMRADVAGGWRFPAPTHSLDRLLHDQWVSGTYWERHEIAVSQRPEIDPRAEGLLSYLEDVLDLQGFGQPWQTVRDATCDLPEPVLGGHPGHLNHVLQPGARAYPGHTGSALDFPAKALKAGGHGVPGGENMLRRVDGSLRYFSVRESARLQTFPDDFELRGAWGESMRQLGNAVPVRLAQAVATSVYAHLRRVDGLATLPAPRASDLDVTYAMSEAPTP